MPYAEKEVLLLRFDRGAAVHVRLSGAVRVYWIAANMLDVMCPSVGVCNSVSIVGKQNKCVVRLRSPSPTYIMFRVLQAYWNWNDELFRSTMCCLDSSKQNVLSVWSSTCVLA